MTTGKIFNISKDNPPVKGCTVSREVYNANGNHVTYYSLDNGTDISAEIYPEHKFLLVSSGKINACSSSINAGEGIITPVNALFGIKAIDSSVYTEIIFDSGGYKMNEIVNVGEVFKLSELVPYQDGRVVSMDIVSNNTMKFALMSFSEGTGLTEHAAPGDALIFAIDGEGIIGYEGQEHRIKAGENFRFAKNGRHYVKAAGKFKMALLLTLEG